MKTLLLLRGISGSGKTTLAEDLRMMGAVIVAADDFQTNEDGEYDWKPERVGWAHKMCQERTEVWMRHVHSLIVVHNTFTTEKEMKPYFELAEKYEYRVHSLIVENVIGTKNVHSVPDETIEKMRNRFVVRL